MRDASAGGAGIDRTSPGWPRRMRGRGCRPRSAVPADRVPARPAGRRAVRPGRRAVAGSTGSSGSGAVCSDQTCGPSRGSVRDIPVRRHPSSGRVPRGSDPRRAAYRALAAAARRPRRAACRALAAAARRRRRAACRALAAAARRPRRAACRALAAAARRPRRAACRALAAAARRRRRAACRAAAHPAPRPQRRAEAAAQAPGEAVEGRPAAEPPSPRQELPRVGKARTGRKALAVAAIRRSGRRRPRPSGSSTTLRGVALDKPRPHTGHAPRPWVAQHALGDRDLLFLGRQVRGGRVLAAAVRPPGARRELQAALVSVAGVDRPVAAGFAACDLVPFAIGGGAGMPGEGEASAADDCAGEGDFRY